MSDGEYMVRDESVEPPLGSAPIMCGDGQRNALVVIFERVREEILGSVVRSKAPDYMELLQLT